jgi:hypothetical protein
MGTEQIEKILANAFRVMGESEEVIPVIVLFPILQAQLLLRILKTLESIDAHLESIGTNDWEDHHNK